MRAKPAELDKFAVGRSRRLIRAGATAPFAGFTIYRRNIGFSALSVTSDGAFFLSGEGRAKRILPARPANVRCNSHLN